MTAFLVRHPIFTTVLNALVFLIGLLCWNQLELEEYPQITKPELSINTFYPNASAELVETVITNSLEEILAGIEGVKFIFSESRSERSSITLKFNEGVSLDRAMILVRDALAQSKDRLPKNIKEPTIQRDNSQEDGPFMAFTLMSSKMNSAELTHFANLYVKNSFRSLKGIASVELWGQPYVMRISLDSKKMKNFTISCHDVIKALEEFNVSVPVGKFQLEVPVIFDLTLKDVDDVKNLVIKNDFGQSALLQYIADIELSVHSDSYRLHVNGKPGVVVAIRKTKEANPLQVANEVKSTFKKLQSQLDDHVKIHLLIDQSKIIFQSLSNIRSTFIESILLVFFVVVAFLGNWRSAFISLVTIPLSIIGSFIFYFLLEISLRGCLVSKIYDKSRDKFHAKERTYGEWFIPVI